MQSKRQQVVGEKVALTLPTTPVSYTTKPATVFGNNGAFGVYISSTSLSAALTCYVQVLYGDEWTQLTDSDGADVTFTYTEPSSDNAAFSFFELPVGVKIRIAFNTSGFTGTINNITIFA